MSAPKKNERRGLGRGLSALMADVTPDEPVTGRRAEVSIPIERIAPNPDQPRRTFVAESLEELAASIRRKGIIQPLILRPHPGNEGQYQIVAGERRWRAAQMAQLHEVPALVREFDDTEVLEVAIVENIQRADLNPVDEAAGYRQLMDRFGRTQEQMAEALGKSRSHIANLLRLLTLPEDVRLLLAEGRLSAGHARALITSDRASDLAREVIRRGLSVRQTEALARKPLPEAPPRRRAPAQKDADTRALERDLSASLGTKVRLDHRPEAQGGRMVIDYASLDQLDAICRLLGGPRED